MASITIINDLHLGTQRQAGTTPMTQDMLRGYLQNWLITFCFEHRGHLVINGDLFDGFTVDVLEVIQAYNTLSMYLSEPTNRITLVAGNHDYSPKGNKLSSFHLLAHFLTAHFNSQVQVIDYRHGFTKISEGLYAIPHMPNQDLFDMQIFRAAGVPEVGTLLLHANCKNTFAENSDHSLNLSAEQVTGLMIKGWNLVFGHEHQGYTLRGGRITVVGNQVPSSIADCLGNTIKQYAVFTDGKLDLVTCWKLEDDYIEVDWTDIENLDHDSYRFIRVIGTATAEQASEVVSTVAKLRQRTQALVVGNAVRIEGVAEFDALAELSFEDLKKVDILALLLEELTEREGNVVKELLK